MCQQGEPGERGLTGPNGAQGPPASTLICYNLSLSDKLCNNYT